MAPSFDVGILAQRNHIRRLAWLGKHDWLRVRTLPGTRRVGTDFDIPPYDGGIPTEEYEALKRTLVFSKASSLTTEAIWVWTLGKLFHGGPKLFRPTLEQCEAMAEVEINLPVSDYQQAYPVVIYQYPEEFSKLMAAKLGCDRFPTTAVCHHNAQMGFIQVSSLFKEGDAITAFIPSRDGETIEQVLMRRGDDHLDANEAEFKLGETLQRIALNFSLMMTQYRVKHNPIDPDGWRKHRQMAKAQNPKKREQGQKLAQADVSIIEFEQHVEMYETRTERGEAGEPTGRHVKPHWRKGHWRMQAHGPQLTLRKRLFIKPLMVKKERFVGETADTTVVYRGHNERASA